MLSLFFKMNVSRLDSCPCNNKDSHHATEIIERLTLQWFDCVVVVELIHRDKQ